MSSSCLLKCEGLKKYFPLRTSVFSRSKKVVHAVDNVDFGVWEGETLGLVGESGCGKTTTGLLILGLLKPTAGKIYFEGKNIFQLKKHEIMRFRRSVQIVFQDPMSSLDPRMTIGRIVSEPMVIHKAATKVERKKRVAELLKEVGLEERYAERHPHEFSGGQRQRIAIARAIALNSKLVILDEPTSALDVSVQAKILNLLGELKRRLNLSYLFISHDLNVIRNVSERTAIMYLGKIVEAAPTQEVFRSPKHPYSEALLSAIPTMDPRSRRVQKRITLKGDVPSPVDPPSGCGFHPRCIYAVSDCKRLEPQLIDDGHGHLVACNLRT